MSRRKIDRRKLEAMAADAAAAPNERAFAQRLLDEMDALGEGREGIIVGVRESWEVALLEILVERHGLTSKEGRGGFVHVNGESGAIDALLLDLVRLQPKLEAVVVSATIGFLSAHFPPTGPASDVPEDPVQAAARRAADVNGKGPKLIGERHVRQIPQR